MHMVTQGITCIVLHVADQYIVPVKEIQGSIWSKLHVHRAKVSVAALNQVLAMRTHIPGPIINHRMLLHPQESNRVVDQQISLNLIREVPT